MDRKTTRVLLVEDNPGDARLIEDMLREAQDGEIMVEQVDKVSAAVESLNEREFDIVLLDVSLPDSHGLETYTRVSRCSPSTPVVMMTGFDDESFALELVQKGAQDYLVKGDVDARQLQRVVRHGMERARTLRELRESKESLQRTKEQLEGALQNINEELETARLVQQSFLPDVFSNVPEIEVSSVYLPCASIGGDLYDIIRIDDNRIGLLILDVAGHGPHAALISAMAKISFTRNVVRHREPASTLEAVNRELHRYIPRSLYLTAFLGVVDISSNTLTYSSAGHPPAMLVRRGRERVDFLKGRGFFVGLMEDSAYTQEQVEMLPGDAVMLYTDGLTESSNVHDEAYGRERLRSLLFQSMDQSPPEVATAIMRDLRTFMGKAAQLDDIAILVIQYKGRDRPAEAALV